MDTVLAVFSGKLAAAGSIRNDIEPLRHGESTPKSSVLPR
jgi:hypothetical protein